MKNGVLLMVALFFAFSASGQQLEKGKFKADYGGFYEYNNIDSLGTASGVGLLFRWSGKNFRLGFGYSWGKFDEIPDRSDFQELDHRYRQLRALIDYHPIVGIVFQPTIGLEFGTIALGVKEEINDEKTWKRLSKSKYVGPNVGFQIYLKQKLSLFGKAQYSFLFDDVEKLLLPIPENNLSFKAGILIHSFN